MPLSPYDGPAVREPSSTLPGLALGHLDALYRLALHLSSSATEAEDLVQDTYARALGKESQFIPGSNVRAWLFRILRNLHVDSWRRARKNPVRETLDGDEPSEDKAERGELLRGDEELDRLRGMVAEDIEAALRQLSPDARTIVLLDLEGFTQEEVAQVMGCEVGTVKSRLSRARARLRELLSDYAR
jgi:RNA polymerase sigma-70 factor (ECF subfamily)